VSATVDTHTRPGAVQERLAEIEDDLATRQPDYEQAADDRARLTRDWDRRLALHMKRASGSNAEARKANGFVAAIEQDNGELYEQLQDAEARFDALRVVMKTLEVRATIGMSIARAQGRGA
jgi:multidrug resistance efflux pump